MAESKVLVSVLLSVIVLSVLFAFITSGTEFSTQVDTFSTPINNNSLSSLSQADGQALTSVTNSTGTTIDASNYTIDFTAQTINLTDNRSLGSTDSMIVTYTYQQDSYIDNTTARVFILLLPIVLALALFIKFSPKGGK